LCQLKRAKGKARYEACVQSWIAKCYGGRDCSVATLSRCRIKYGTLWPKLQTLSGTACDRPRYADNGDGTVADALTGLVWEKKTTDGSISDVASLYTWAIDDGDSANEDGSAFTVFLQTLNVESFGGASGWRLPTFAELQTILLPELYPCSVSPCIDMIFGDTAPGFYWSSTTSPPFPGLDFAWLVDFSNGDRNREHKREARRVRAVRGGF
jgi:hypothetical protein